jgi:hypothetical protein
MAVADPVAQTITKIAEYVAEGHCILFLGAAVHAPPPEGSPYSYPEAERPPIGSGLARYLAQELAIEERDMENLARVALEYETEYLRQPLVDRITAAVHDGKTPSPALRALARMSFPIVITTNYDQLFERALRDPSVGKDPSVIVYSSNEQHQTAMPHTDPTAAQPLVLKLHGDIANVDDIVITDEDYIQFILRMSDKDPYNPVPMYVRLFLTRWPTLFVGYRLQDYNLRLLFKTLRWNVDRASFPPMYSVDRDPDPLIVKVWEQKFVKWVVQDVWDFVPDLYGRIMGEEMPQ